MYWSEKVISASRIIANFLNTFFFINYFFIANLDIL